MYGFKDFVAANKKVIVSVGAALAAVVTASTAASIVLNGEDTTDEVTPPTSYVENDFSLPSADEVSVETPMLYDYVMGCLGANTDYDMISSNYYVFATKEGSSKFYLSILLDGQGDETINTYLPKFSTEPAAWYASDGDEKDTLLEALESVATKTTEGEYIFYTIDTSEVGYEDFDASNFGGLNLNTDFDTSTGYTETEVTDGGQGYPTSLIREKCDLDKIYELYNIDFNDSFWDSVNYGAKIKCYMRDDSSTYCVLQPTVIRYISDGDFVNTFLVNGDYPVLGDVDTLDAYLIEEGYQTTSQALSNMVYCTQTEYDALVG